MEYRKAERLLLKTHPEFNEKWVQNRIMEDPSILGLGDLEFRQAERRQPSGGRLDLLLQDDDGRRYEVELQLGATDEAHIIRTIEYWDVERKRYPSLDHCAVIIAEDVTSRFLNVISLFAGSVPIIALQMQAVRVGDHISLVFSRVVDELRLGVVGEGEDEIATPITRAEWEKRAPGGMEVAEELFSLVKEIDPAFEIKYNQSYLGVRKGDKVTNFVAMLPRKGAVVADMRMKPSDDIKDRLEEMGLGSYRYDSRLGAYKLRLQMSDIQAHKDILRDLIRAAYDYRTS